MILYRVENTENIGCYLAFHCSLEVLEMIARHEQQYPDVHPNPSNDEGILRPIDSSEQCAFSDMEQLLDWFTESELEILRENGFNIVEFEAEVTAIGAKQVLFKSDSRKDMIKC